MAIITTQFSGTRRQFTKKNLLVPSLCHHTLFILCAMLESLIFPIDPTRGVLKTELECRKDVRLGQIES